MELFSGYGVSVVHPKKTRLKRKHLFFLFGLYDVFCIGFYLEVHCAWGDVPYWSEFVVFFATYNSDPHAHGLDFLTLWIVICYLSNVSILISCVLFFLRKRSVKYVVYFQLPLRWFLLGILLLFIIGGSLGAAWPKALIALAIGLALLAVEIYRTRFVIRMKPWFFRKVLAPHW